MAAIVQTSAYGSFAPGAGSISFAGTVASGNDVILFVDVSNWIADPTSVTDDKANTYTQEGSLAAVGAGSVDKVMVYRCKNVVNAPLTVTLSVASRGYKCVAYAVSGLTSAAVASFQAFTLAATTTPSQAFTTATAGCAVFAAMTTTNTGAPKVFTAGSLNVAWTSVPATADNVAYEAGIAGAAGTYNADGSLPSANGLWDIWVASFAATAAASTSSGFKKLLLAGLR